MEATHLDVRAVRSDSEVSQAAKLMLELVDLIRERYGDQLEMIEDYYRGSWFFSDEPGLPDEYCPPQGDVLVAYSHGRPAGTVAICRQDDVFCELKFMFVPPGCRRAGIATALCRAVINIARVQGYQGVRLSTGERQPEAQALYRKLGFELVIPWEPDPPAGISYFEYRL